MKRVTMALAVLAACAAAPYWPGPWAALRAFVLILVPGWTLLALLAPGVLRRPALAASATVLSSAVATPATLFLLARLSGGIHAALVPFGWLWGVAAVVVLLRRKALAVENQVTGDRLRDLGILLATAVLLGLPMLVNGALRSCSDAWTHIALVRTQLAGPDPWTDPRFVGQPLRYFWFYNYWAAAFAARGGLSIPWSLEVINHAGLLAFVSACLALARALWVDRRQALASAAVVLLGLAPFGWLGILTRLLTGVIGEHRGRNAVLAAWKSLHFLDRDVTDTLTPIFCSPVHWQAKFLVITPFGLALAASVLMSAVLWGAAKRRRLEPGDFVVLTSCYAALLLHHLVAAAFTGVTLGASLVLPRLLRRSPFTWRQTAGAVGTFVVPLLASLPYCRGILGGRELAVGNSGYGVGVEGTWLLTAALALGPVLALLYYGRVRLRAALGEATAMFVTYLIVALLLVVFFRMPTVNENKLQLIFYCTVAPLGAVGIDRWLEVSRRHPRRRNLGRGILAVSLPIPIVLWIGFLCHVESPVAPGIDDAGRWLKRESPVDAVLVEPVMSQRMLNRAEREMFVSKPNFIAECGYPRAEMGRRLDLVRDLYAHGSLRADQVEILHDLGRPVYVLWSVVEAPTVRPDPALFRLVFRAEDAEIYQVAGGVGE